MVIENQLELSDNDHFVRLVGYAADHDAKILIWVAPQFDEYHQRLLGWLDQAPGDARAIPAVQVKLVPGGDLRSADADPEQDSILEQVLKTIGWRGPTKQWEERADQLLHRGLPEREEHGHRRAEGL